MLKRRILFSCFVIFFFSIIVSVSNVQCQTWTALPPYNTLWPLWSPALSPIDTTTQLPTPIISSLARSTVLPVQPAITWDPYLPFPWFLYNTPVGLIFFDVEQGFFAWPPSYLINPFTFSPAPITLPTDYSTLAPVATTFLLQYVPYANSEYIQQFGPNAFLLTALELAAP
ncbi:MAG: hypothetical protein ACMUJM_15465 [bacterium]